MGQLLAYANLLTKFTNMYLDNNGNLKAHVTDIESYKRFYKL